MPRPASDTPAPRSPQGKAPALIPEPGPLDWLDSGLLARVTQAIRTCPRYGAGAGEVEAVRTHISAVFLTPEYVFKFKRPVALGFADFSTLSLRKRYCREEQRLNRRLAPEVYLEVLPLYASRETPGEVLSLAGGEQVVDWCVVMRRLPREDMLDARVRQGRVTPEDMASVASLLAEFHRRPSRRKHLEHFGSLEVLQGNWDENFRQMEPFIGRTIPPGVFQTLQNSVGEFIRRNEGLLRGRAAQGFIRDGHGDLRCEHIALGAGGIRIIDCIEFNDRFRFGGV
ncbi:MAG: hypothetical protein OEW39_06195, partial [Deltaproteobacteria bacterium]|nr:hypothetical protein [Deltaproteobacteria bacterium]